MFRISLRLFTAWMRNVINNCFIFISFMKSNSNLFISAIDEISELFNNVYNHVVDLRVTHWIIDDIEPWNVWTIIYSCNTYTNTTACRRLNPIGWFQFRVSVSDSSLFAPQIQSSSWDPFFPKSYVISYQTWSAD